MHVDQDATTENEPSHGRRSLDPSAIDGGSVIVDHREHRRRPRGRRLAFVACLALAIGSVALLSGLGGEEGLGPVVVLPEPEDGTLALAAPTDGRESMGLPLAVAPATELTDVQAVDVTGEGFDPGESVGVVQCAVEAARLDRGGEAAGIDACDIAPYTALTADQNGFIGGSYKVQRALTTAWTGTIDCAERPGRCILAAGALSDYDRSGGFPIAFATGGLQPLQVPSLVVTPADELVDGDVVRITGAGFPTGSAVSLELCSLDPASCWNIGESQGEPPDQDGNGGWVSYGPAVGAVADGAGTFDVVTEVWRYFPGPTVGTYVDCATSPCAIRARAMAEEGADSTVSSPPARLRFVAGGEPPSPAALSVAPREDVATGDRFTVAGSGFVPGSFLLVTHCATPSMGDGPPITCAGVDHAPPEIGEDGTFELSADLPPLEAWGSTECDGNGPCAAETAEAIDCADDAWRCDIRVEAGPRTEGPPSFPPTPVPLRYRD